MKPLQHARVACFHKYRRRRRRRHVCLNPAYLPWVQVSDGSSHDHRDSVSDCHADVRLLECRRLRPRRHEAILQQVLLDPRRQLPPAERRLVRLLGRVPVQAVVRRHFACCGDEDPEAICAPPDHKHARHVRIRRPSVNVLNLLVLAVDCAASSADKV